MAKPLASRTPLILLLVTPLLGCVAKPPERYIVLRPYHSERRMARPIAKPAPITTPDGVAGAVPASADQKMPLNSTEKEALFRDFDAFLARSRPSP